MEPSISINAKSLALELLDLNRALDGLEKRQEPCLGALVWAASKPTGGHVRTRHAHGEGPRTVCRPYAEFSNLNGSQT